MFGLEGSGFIVAVGLTLLVSGVVVYYCNSRLSRIEESVRNQNKVLGDFITSVQEGLISEDGQLNVVGGEHMQAGGATENYINTPNMVQHIELGDNRVVVSDNDSDSESESESLSLDFLKEYSNNVSMSFDDRV